MKKRSIYCLSLGGGSQPRILITKALKRSENKHPGDHTGRINFTIQHLVLILVSLLCECPQAGSLLLEECHRDDIREEQIKPGAIINCSSLASLQHVENVYISEACYIFQHYGICLESKIMVLTIKAAKLVHIQLLWDKDRNVIKLHRSLQISFYSFESFYFQKYSMN